MNKRYIKVMGQFMNLTRSWAFSVLILCIGFSVSFGADIPESMARNRSVHFSEMKPQGVTVTQLTKQEQALFNAVKTGDITQVKKLIADGVDVNCHYADGFSLLHMATVVGDDKVVSLLLKNKANPNGWWTFAFSELTGSGDHSFPDPLHIEVSAWTPL
ncbi:MAG: ankyrin repeat domain-containing protein, partial [Acidobacteria bacterium]|nr:ankyrin repeat domain-containing protein [Acidobacteriota bacterium]